MTDSKKKWLTLAASFAMAATLCAGLSLEAERTSAELPDTVTETETTITKVHLRNSRLLFFLDGVDYSEAGPTTAAAASWDDCNTADSILVYTSETDCVTLREAFPETSAKWDKNVYYNIWTETNSVSYQLDGDVYDATNVTKVVIPAGTQFPSFNYTNGEGTTVYTIENTYVLTNNATTAKESMDWSISVEVEPTETEVSVTMYGFNNNRLGIQLSQSDYATANQGFEYTAIASLNTLSKITYNGVALSEASSPLEGNIDAYLNMWTHPNTFYFPMEAPVAGDTIVIPKGTQFPSSAYIADGTPNYYVTTEDATFKFDGTNWGKVIVFEETNVSVGVYDYANNSIGLQLSESDYATPNQAFKPVVIAALNTLSSITYNDVALKDCLGTANDGQMLLQMWTRPNTIYFPMAEPKAEDTIVIPAGTQFPSSAFIANGTETCYVATETVTYKFDGANWGKVIDFEETEVSVTMYGYNNGRLGIQLSQSDYDTPNQGFEYSEISALNTMSNITYNGVALNESAPAKEGEIDGYLQMWTHPNTFYFAIAESAEGDKIVIPAGTQFPSSAFIANGTETCYVTTEEAIFVYVNGVWEAYAESSATVVDATGASTVVAYNTENRAEKLAEIKAMLPADAEEGYEYVWAEALPDVLPLDSTPTFTIVKSAIEYTVTFVADGETVGTDTYTVEDKEITVPEVPAKDGYTAVWESYELTTGEVTVNAVYTKIPDEPTPENPDKPLPEEESTGCGSVIGGVSVAIAMLGAAVVALKKKKED